MTYEILLRPSHSVLRCVLAGGEEIFAESGAMLAMDPSATIEGKVQGGMLQGLKRAFLTNESFFVTTIRATKGDTEVLLTPRSPGDVEAIELKDEEYIVQAGTFLASTAGVKTDATFSGWKGFVGGQGLFMIKASGTGSIFVSSFGGLLKKELKPGQQCIVDNGHVVAFRADMQYTVDQVGTGFGAITTGEGLAYLFTGPGAVYLQTRNLKTFTETLNPFLPDRSSSQGGGILGQIMGG